MSWKDKLNIAREELGKNKGDGQDRLLVAYCDLSKRKSDDEHSKSLCVRVPCQGGSIFVSADQNSPAAKGLQADLNAAANIGLRALLDPDWPGRWWYVPAKLDHDQYIPKSENCAGASCLKDWKVPRKDCKETKNKTVVYLWRDISANPLMEGEWQNYADYWEHVRGRVVDILRSHAGLDERL